MKRNRTVAAIALAMALVAAPALAGTTTWPSAKVSVDTPAGWTATIKGNEVDLAAPKGDIAVVFVTVPAGAVKDASTAVGRQLGKSIDNLKVKETKPVTINGMSGSMVDGSGSIKGAPVVWMVLILDTPATDVDLMSITIAADATLSAHKSEVDFIFNHLKPTS
jgi:hypothetical protein